LPKWKIYRIKDGTNNEVYTYGNYIIKVSTKSENLKHEYSVLKKLT
jgi:hypothetical protein